MHPRHEKLNRAARALAVAVALALAGSVPAAAQPVTEPPLVLVDTWPIPPDDLPMPARATHRLRLEMVTFRDTPWSPEVIVAAVREAAVVLGQCGVRVNHAELLRFDGGPRAYRYLYTPVSRQLARRLPLTRPGVFFIEDTRQEPAFDAEAVGRRNSGNRPEMTDTVWITAGMPDLPLALAHELVHVLSDSGEHSDEPGNLMNAQSSPANRTLTPAQCARLRETGERNGLLQPGAG